MQRSQRSSSGQSAIQTGLPKGVSSSRSRYSTTNFLLRSRSGPSAITKKYQSATNRLCTTVSADNRSTPRPATDSCTSAPTRKIAGEPLMNTPEGRRRATAVDPLNYAFGTGSGPAAYEAREMQTRMSFDMRASAGIFLSGTAPRQESSSKSAICCRARRHLWIEASQVRLLTVRSSGRKRA